MLGGTDQHQRRLRRKQNTEYINQWDSIGVELRAKKCNISHFCQVSWSFSQYLRFSYHFWCPGYGTTSWGPHTLSTRPKGKPGEWGWRKPATTPRENRPPGIWKEIRNMSFEIRWLNWLIELVDWIGSLGTRTEPTVSNSRILRFRSMQQRVNWNTVTWDSNLLKGVHTVNRLIRLWNLVTRCSKLSLHLVVDFVDWLIQHLIASILCRGCSWKSG